MCFIQKVHFALLHPPIHTWTFVSYVAHPPPLMTFALSLHCKDNYAHSRVFTELEISYNYYTECSLQATSTHDPRTMQKAWLSPDVPNTERSYFVCWALSALWTYPHPYSTMSTDELIFVLEEVFILSFICFHAMCRIFITVASAEF